MDDNNVENRTVFCGGLSDEVTEGILFDLFNQAGPVESVRRPRDPANGRMKTFGFIVFKHDCSAPYAVELFRGTKLFNRNLTINTRSRVRHIPVLDTHLNDFTRNTRSAPSHVPVLETHFNDLYSHQITPPSSRGEKRSHDNRREYGTRNHNNRDNDRWRRRVEDNGSRKDYESEPSSWSALKGQGLAANGYNRNDLQSSSRSMSRDLLPEGHGAVAPPDFNALLQQGQQMLLPGMFPPAALPIMPMMGMGMGMGLGPGLGMSPNMLPSMQGGYNGGRVSPDRHSHRGDHRDNRRGWRDRPYDRQERRDDHHHHSDRRYSSSRSSHDREHRDRRSR